MTKPSELIKDKIDQRKSRAVLKTILPGSGNPITCKHCDSKITFSSKNTKAVKVVCNVYIKGSWVRVEQYHHDCYFERKRYGVPIDGTARPRV